MASYRHLVSIPNKATVGEILDDVVIIARGGNREDAARYKQMLVNRRIRNVPNEPVMDSEQGVAANIGYLSGYGSTEERRLICEIFETTHPFFGDTDPTPEEALQMGVDWARASKTDPD